MLRSTFDGFGYRQRNTSKQCAAASPDGCVVGDQQQQQHLQMPGGSPDSIIQIKIKFKLI
jgi:hypothetical protein